MLSGCEPLESRQILGIDQSPIYENVIIFDHISYAACLVAVDFSAASASASASKRQLLVAIPPIKSQQAVNRFLNFAPNQSHSIQFDPF